MKGSKYAATFFIHPGPIKVSELIALLLIISVSMAILNRYEDVEEVDILARIRNHNHNISKYLRIDK